MAHQIEEFDDMISVHEVPWHGLGTILDDYPSIEEAQQLSGLTWQVRKEPVCFNNSGEISIVPGSFITVRDDINMPLGVVGSNYEAFQNTQMFSFMDEFMKQAGSKIETCGSLRNGRTVWALSQAGTVEYVNGDPTNKYFLFKNAFDGSSAIEICFTDVRVVCNNTLSAALNGATNTWRIRHTAAMHGQLGAIREAILRQQAHGEAMKEVMAHLANRELSTREMLETVAKTVINDVKDADDVVTEDHDILAEVTNQQRTTITKIVDLFESGAGMELKGVRGTAYGLLQAFTEYTDHFRTSRATEGRSKEEARFESILMGAAADFKVRAFNNILALAA